MDGGLFEVYFTSLIVEMASQQVAVHVCVARLDICSMPHWAHAIVAWDLWLRPSDLAPAPLEPPPCQGSQLLDSTSCSCGDSTMPRFEAASLLSTPVLIAYGIFSAVVFVAMLYKAQHEQLDVFMASAWIYQSNGCLLVRRKVVSQ